MKTITLSKDNILNYTTKQQGSGRQGLYLLLHNIDGCPVQQIYFGSVFPNVKEHFGLYTWDEVFPKMRATDKRDRNGWTIFEEVEGEYVDNDENDVDADHIFPTIFDGLVAMATGDEVEVKEFEDDKNE